MVAIRFISLLLVLGFGAPTWAATTIGGKVVEAYVSPGVQTENNFTDYTEFQCESDGSGSPLTDFGCVDNDGVLCSSITTDICDTQRVPPGRCSGGTATACIFPAGAGLCAPDAGTTYNDIKIGCLPDDPTKLGETTGLFTAAVCAAGANSDCDMATNNTACSCQGTDPTAAGWEGTICGNDPQSRCSDGDIDRGFAGYAGALCTSIDTNVGGNDASGGRCADSNRFPGLPGSPSYGVENVAKKGTPQRRPGTSLSLPSTRIRPIQVTATWAFDKYDDPNAAHFKWNIRSIKMFGNSYFQDFGWGSAQTNAANLDNTIVTHFCDPPQPWQTNLPLEGFCVDDPNTVPDESTTACINDLPDCAAGSINLCDPLTKKYCWQLARDTEGLIFTRDFTDADIVAIDPNALGICPPDCNLDHDWTSFEQQAVVDAGDPSLGKDPRVGVQLALDSGYGPRAGKGDLIYVVALTSMTWLDPDNRCYMGGDPGVVDATCTAGTCGTSGIACSVTNDPNGIIDDCAHKLGRCVDSDQPCDPTQLGEPCGAGITCNFCGGTYDGSFGTYLAGYQDTANGTPTALPPGYFDPTGKTPLHTAGDSVATRVGGINDLNTDVRFPIYAVFTSGAGGTEFRDNTCNPAGRDHCALGEVTTGGGDGISPEAGTQSAQAGGSFTTSDIPAYDPLGGVFSAGSTWLPSSGGTESSTNTFLRIFDRNSGPDGVHGCLGDNIPIGNNTACDQLLGGSNVGSTGSDDVALVHDFSRAQDGSRINRATFSRYKMNDPTRDTPIWNAVSAIGLRDGQIVFPNNLDFINKTNSTWCPLDADGNQNCDRDAESFCGECGGDGNADGICDCVNAGCDRDKDGICDLSGGPTGPDNCPAVANPAQTINAQGATQAVKPDGIACACLCGDVNRDCVINSSDKLEIVLNSGFAPPALLWDPVYCDVNRDGLCNSSDGLELVLWSGFAPPQLAIVFGAPHGGPGSGVVCF